MQKMNRRHFIATSALGATTIALTSHVGATGASDLPMLAIDDPIAIALGYKPIAAEVDTSKFPKRAGTEGAKQFCSNCALYKELDSGTGTCTAIPNKLVAGPGWCNAWVPTP